MRPLGFGICFVWLAGSCGTNAVGVAECRDVERARCSAALSCGFPDVESCQRFYRDHCLHGMVIEEVNQIQIDVCVAELGRAGRCASEAPDSAPDACSEPIQTVRPVRDVCSVVFQPELASACAFLAPPEPTPAAPAGDAGGG